jgi:uncharacterized NAD-dependent epimerase/dehydratase family protein
VKAVNPTSPCCGTFLERPSNVAVAAVAVKGGRPQAAAAALAQIRADTGLVCVDPVREGADRLLQALMQP